MTRPTFTMRASDYAEQGRRAHEMMEQMTQQLVADGWVWHQDIMHWLHPDKPGEMIGY